MHVYILSGLPLQKEFSMSLTRYIFQMFMNFTNSYSIGFLQKNKRSAEKVAIDGTFIKRIAAILRIIIPGVFSPEAGFMILVAAALVARSSCDIWMIQNSTSIERLILILKFYNFISLITKFLGCCSAIIGRNFPLFKSYVIQFIAAMPMV